MKKHQKVLLGIMALSLAGGIGTAIALTRNAAAQQPINGNTDTAVYLYWGSKQTTATFASVKDLEPDTPVYRHLTVSPQVSANLKGKVTLTFTLAPKTNHVLTGLKVGVYKVDTAEKETDLGTAACTLTASTTEVTGTASFDVETQSATHEDVAYYTIEFVYDGTQIAEDENYGGTLTVTQAFAAE